MSDVWTKNSLEWHQPQPLPHCNCTREGEQEGPSWAKQAPRTMRNNNDIIGFFFKPKHSLHNMSSKHIKWPKAVIWIKDLGQKMLLKIAKGLSVNSLSNSATKSEVQPKGRIGGTSSMPVDGLLHLDPEWDRTMMTRGNSCRIIVDGPLLKGQYTQLYGCHTCEEFMLSNEAHRGGKQAWTDWKLGMWAMLVPSPETLRWEAQAWKKQKLQEPIIMCLPHANHKQMPACGSTEWQVWWQVGYSVSLCSMIPSSNPSSGNLARGEHFLRLERNLNRLKEASPPCLSYPGACSLMTLRESTLPFSMLLLPATSHTLFSFSLPILLMQASGCRLHCPFRHSVALKTAEFLTHLGTLVIWAQ